ncbi:MAG TPA: MFS transporter [Burkholderiales bacterium]|nr:MFS transporter [Burkholderiales bacterium]
MNERSQFSLLGERRFGPFFCVQFLGAFNDNVFKQALVIMLAYQTASFTAMSSDALQNLAQALFILPFLLFSATAGQIADKYEKSTLISITIALELGIMALGAAGLMLKNLTILLVALFLGGVQSTLFGPVKYAILPQHLKETELIGGNALVEGGTSIAVLLGMIYGGSLIAFGAWGLVAVAASTCAVSATALVVSRFIPRAPAADPALRINWNPITETWRNLAHLTERRVVFLSILGVSWFWFYGAIVVTQFPNLARNVLHGDEYVVTLLLVVFSLGVAGGSLLCERLSGHKVELGLVPFGSIGLTLFGIDLWWALSHVADTGQTWTALGFLGEHAHWRLLADIALIGIFSGFYIVPLYALIQTRSDAATRSRVIAGNNILNALFIVAASALAIGLFQLGFTIPQVFLATALVNAAVAVYIYTLVPEFLMRFMAWMLIHSVYRLEKRGLDHIPDEGAALVVCNHVSYVDALVISAACRRPIRWVMDHNIFRVPLLSFFFRTARAIPIAPARENEETLRRAYEEIARALENGELVGIFPEGRLTRDGEIGEFRGGVSRILDRTPVPVIPMALSGLWQSLFARNREAIKRAHTRLFPRVRLVVGGALQPEVVTPLGLREVVSDLRGNWQ